MSNVVGIAGARRSAAAALCRHGELVAFCEQERVTRQKHVGLVAGALPREAVECVLAVGDAGGASVTYAAAEDEIALPMGAASVRCDHHFAHAVTAFCSSPFDEAAVLVCDRHSPGEVTAWRGTGERLHPVELESRGEGLARKYSDVVNAFGLTPGAEEFRFEILAELGDRNRPPADLDEDPYGLRAAKHLAQAVHDLLGAGGGADASMRAAIAAAVQRSLAAELVEFARRVRETVATENVCLAGGLFFNSFLTTAVARAGIFKRTFVPVNPGNAGVAAGAAVAASRAPGEEGLPRPRRPWSPFLGPEYSPEGIKAVLDNCKLSYEFLRDDLIVERTVDALKRGRLVGWFQGRMEWGARALGNRSILASPIAPFTSENLNRFLKHRPSYRSYSVSICAEQRSRFFDGPESSDYMEFEYDVFDPGKFCGLLPALGRRCRVQTVGSDPAPFRRLLEAFGQATGIPALVNTSFNGFSEPMVCSPRDAVRVFYGTGLDLLVIGNFLVKK